jgi:hypothetical protein
MSSLVEAASRLWDEADDGDIATASMTEAAAPAPTPYQPTERQTRHFSPRFATSKHAKTLLRGPKPPGTPQGNKDCAFEEEAPAPLGWWGGGEETAHLQGSTRATHGKIWLGSSWARKMVAIGSDMREGAGPRVGEDR